VLGIHVRYRALDVHPASMGEGRRMAEKQDEERERTNAFEHTYLLSVDRV
jgi:hypothetical protein